jgi:hypothetical protein
LKEDDSLTLVQRRNTFAAHICYVKIHKLYLCFALLFVSGCGLCWPSNVNTRFALQRLLRQLRHNAQLHALVVVSVVSQVSIVCYYNMPLIQTGECRENFDNTFVRKSVDGMDKCKLACNHLLINYRCHAKAEQFTHVTKLQQIDRHKIKHKQTANY